MKTHSTHFSKKQHHDKMEAPAPPRTKNALSRGETALPASASWLILILLALFVYLPTLRASFIWDDNALTENPLVKSASGFWKICPNPA